MRRACRKFQRSNLQPKLESQGKMSIAITSLTVFVASQVATPGPANMALLAAGARYGFSGALPFVAGVAFGKQLIIWPMGFGLMELANRAPGLFELLKWLSAAYICWLAWKIANLRLNSSGADVRSPGFAAGLLVHPLNPKAWAMVTAAFANFAVPGASAFLATALIASVFLAVQALLHPVWAWGGSRIFRAVAGTRAETWLMWMLAAATAASVGIALAWGGG